MSFLGSMFQNNSGVENIDAATFENKLKEDDNAVLLDVRTEGEFNEGHLPDAQLIDIMNPAFQQEIEKLDRNKSYYLYCRSGNRSYHAGRTMAQMGFEKVYNLKNGIISWNGEVE